MNKIEPRWAALGFFFAVLCLITRVLSKTTVSKSLARTHGMGFFWVTLFLFTGCGIAGAFTYFELHDKLLTAGMGVTSITLVLAALVWFLGEDRYERWYNKIRARASGKVVIISILISCSFIGLVLIIRFLIFKPLPFHIVYIICSIITISIVLIYLLRERPT